MQCAEFESRLNDLLDQRRRLDADHRLAEHARRCGECRNLAAAYEAVVLGLEQSRLPEPSADLAARILAKVAAETKAVLPAKLTPAERHPQRVFSRPGRYFAVAALAATLLLAVAWRWTVGPAVERRAGPDHAELAAQKSASDLLAAQNAPPPPAPERPGSREALLERDAYRGLAAETSQSLAVAMQLFPGVGERKEPDATTANEAGSDWMHGLSDGLKPVTRPTAGAVNSFFQLLAASDKGSRS